MIIFFVLGITCVDAEICDEEDVAKVKNLVSNVTPKTEYIGDLENKTNLQDYFVSFDFGELNGEISYHESYRSGFMEQRSLDGELRMESGDKSVDFFYDRCGSMKVATVSFHLPKFNEYSLRDECKDLQEVLEVCDPWYQGRVKDSAFLDAISRYHLENDKEEFTILGFLTKHYLIVGGVSIFLIVLVISIFVIRYRKYSKLD